MQPIAKYHHFTRRVKEPVAVNREVARCRTGYDVTFCWMILTQKKCQAL